MIRSLPRRNLQCRRKGRRGQMADDTVDPPGGLISSGEPDPPLTPCDGGSVLSRRFRGDRPGLDARRLLAAAARTVVRMTRRAVTSGSADPGRTGSGGGPSTADERRGTRGALSLVEFGRFGGRMSGVACRHLCSAPHRSFLGSWRRREAHVDQPARISRRAAPTGSATWCSSGPAAPARPPWWRRCSPQQEPSRAPAPSATAPRSATSRTPSTPTSGPSRWRSPRSCTAGVKVNLVDTPGYADFVGELRAGLRAADCALFVIAANEGVDDATKTLWRECADVGMPRAVVITKLDQASADYDGVLLAAQDAFGEKVMPLYLPVRSARRGHRPGRPALAVRARRRRAARVLHRGRHRGVRGRDADGPLPRR